MINNEIEKFIMRAFVLNLICQIRSKKRRKCYLQFINKYECLFLLTGAISTAICFTDFLISCALRCFNTLKCDQQFFHIVVD